MDRMNSLYGRRNSFVSNFDGMIRMNVTVGESLRRLNLDCTIVFCITCNNEIARCIF